MKEQIILYMYDNTILSATIISIVKQFHKFYIIISNVVRKY